MTKIFTLTGDLIKKTSEENFVEQNSPHAKNDIDVLHEMNLDPHASGKKALKILLVYKNIDHERCLLASESTFLP